MPCPHVSGCPLYSQFKLKTLLKYWSSVYCEGTWSGCERYKLATQGEEVPPTLLPNGKRLAPAAK